MPDLLFLPFRNQDGQNPHSASSRIRCDWVAKYMDEAEVADPEREKKVFADPENNTPRVVVFQKRFAQMQDRDLALKLRGLGRKVIFDLCDSEWAHPERAEPLKQMMSAADVLTASTTYVASWMQKESGKDALIIPDRLDLELHPLSKVHTDHEPIVLGWYGNKLTIEYLKDIEQKLRDVYAENLFELHVIWENEEPFALDNIVVKNITWDLETFNEEVLKCDIILNPHRDDAIGRGKSNNKTITAWALGLPCLENEQLELLPHYIKNTNLRYSEAMIGRNEVVNRYDVKESVETWRTILKQVA